jgi:hypothetical protein
MTPEKQLEKLNHELRNKALELEAILRKMNKALKEFEEELSEE